MQFLRSLHEYLGRLDFEKPGNTPLTSMTSQQKKAVALHNGYHAALETANAIPVVSVVTGAPTMVLGAIELALGGIMSFFFEADSAGAVARGGAKTLALGAAATFLPGFGNVANGIAAAGDTVDMLNSAA